MPDLNVLVVDDEPAVRQVLAAAIGKAGYVVETAASASEALARLDKAPFDVVLSDVFMPVTDGIELLKQARVRGHAATFIMVTAFASVGGTGRSEIHGRRCNFRHYGHDGDQHAPGSGNVAVS